MPNLVPYDKFRPDNLEKACEYLSYLNMISPECVKFGNKTRLKGKAHCIKKARRDVLT